MNLPEFDRDDYMAMLRTCQQVPGMSQWPPQRAARLMAILQVWGNNEGFVYSPKFNCDREFIQEIYHLQGGEVPDRAFTAHLRAWIATYEDLDEHSPLFRDAREWIQQKYGFKLIC